VVGRHQGIHQFTVGQRKGLGVATGSPLYVLEVRGESRQVVVGNGEALFSRTLRARQLNWIATDGISAPMRVSAKIRHRHQPSPATVEQVAEDEAVVTFDAAQRAITPGQAVVLYDGDVVVGGGWIA